MSASPNNQGILDGHQNLTSSLVETKECLTAHERQLMVQMNMLECIMKVLETLQILQAKTSQLQSVSNHQTDSHSNDNCHERNE